MGPQGQPIFAVMEKIEVFLVVGDRCSAEITLRMPNAVGGELEVRGIWSQHPPIGVDIDISRWFTFDSPNVDVVFGGIVDAPGGLKKLPGIGVGGEGVGGSSAVVVVTHVGDELVDLMRLQVA